MTDFIEYLNANAQAKAGGKRLFEPGIYNEGAKKTWTALPSPRVVTDAELLSCEERLGIKLPMAIVRLWDSMLVLWLKAYLTIFMPLMLIAARWQAILH